MKSEEYNTRNESMDMAKLVMSISIVAMHSSLFTGSPLACLIWPWARISVPLFFMMSSYFLFRKNPDAQNLRRFFVRLIKMYIFWFVISLPATIYYRWSWWWQEDGVLFCCLRFLRSLVFSSTFGASWFLSALGLGTLLVDISGKQKNRQIGWGICVLCYIVSSIWSSYIYFSQNNEFLNSVSWIERNLIAPQRSFIVAFLWIFLGRMMVSCVLVDKIRFRCLVFGLILSFALLWGEWFGVWWKTRLHMNDCYFMLVPCCLIVFEMLKRMPKCGLVNYIEEKLGSGSVREFSTVLFFVHLQIQSLLREFIPNGIIYNIPLFVFTLFLSFCAYLLIERMRTYKSCEFLKWAY